MRVPTPRRPPLRSLANSSANYPAAARARFGAVAVVASVEARDVDVDNVAVVEYAGVGDAVADDLQHTCATYVTEGCRGR